jgi:hypothetical protein
MTLPATTPAALQAADPARHHLDHLASLRPRRKLRRLGLHADVGLLSDQRLQRLG